MPHIVRPDAFAQYGFGRGHAQHWDAAILKRAVPFLDGEQVLIATANTHMVQGEVTGIVPDTLSSQYPHLQVVGEHNRMLVRVSDVREIVVLSGAGVAWQLSTKLHEESMAATAAVRKFIGSDWPAGAPYKGQRKFTVTPTWDGTKVAWGESFRDRAWLVAADGTVTVYA